MVGSIQSLDTLEDIESIPFGIKSLDEITGINGIPRGRVTEIYGAESNGKTALTMSAISEAQKQGLNCAFIDMELSMTKEFAEMSDVNLNNLIYIQPINGEEALTVTEALLEAKIDLIIIDSVASMVSEKEIERGFNEDSIGLQARLMSKAMRKLLGLTKRSNTALVFINQIRSDINKMGFGPKNTTSGGRALKFYSSLRLEVARTGWISVNNEKRGMSVKIRTIKNKMSTPQKTTEFNFMFGSGFDKDLDLLNYYVKDNKINLIGRTYYINNKKIGNKKEATEWLKNPENLLTLESN